MAIADLAHSDLDTVDASVLQDLVDANHILYRQRVVDGFGHVSARHPSDPRRFIMARSMAPGLVTRADLMLLGLDGAPLAAHAPPAYLERFIHAAIYAARPDVAAVVHNHSPGVIPFGAVPDAPLRPICHLAGFIGAAAPVFEIRDAAGRATDMLIRTPQLGAALAARLGAANLILMRGHGATMVGHSIRQAVFRAVYTEAAGRSAAPRQTGLSDRRGSRRRCGDERRPPRSQLGPLARRRRLTS
jgi:ribulose-5-phosphate 4-epimerase/fuculose-1-phosphate aldolase